jgi:hypothetical protein
MKPELKPILIQLLCKINEKVFMTVNLYQKLYMKMTWFYYMIVDFKNFFASLKYVGLDSIVFLKRMKMDQWNYKILMAKSIQQDIMAIVLNFIQLEGKLELKKGGCFMNKKLNYKVLEMKKIK